MARLYFVLGLVCTCSVSGQSPTYGLMGLKVTLKPDITGTGTGKQPDEILWKHNGNKVVEFDGRKQQEFGLFKNRVTLDWISAELSITDLRLDDSGIYDLEIYADKVLKRQTLNLEVLEKLAKPNIKCEKSNDGEEATLTCSLESRQPQSLTYEWISYGPGQNLTVPLSDKNEEYTCMVRNPLSNEAAKVTAKACYPDEGVSVTLIAILSVAVFLLVATVVACIIYCKKNNKGLNNETPHNEEGTSLIHRTPTVPSDQRLGRELLSNNYMTSDLETSDTENTELCKDEIPVKGSVRKRAQEFEKNPHIKNLFQGKATGPLRKSPCEGSNSRNKGEADAEQLDPSHSEQETQPDTKQPSCEGPDVPSNEKSDADAEHLDPSHSEQETEAGGDFTGLNSEAPQNKQSNPPSEPPAPSGQQPVSPPQDDTNMTSTCDEPDYKNDQTDKEDGQSQMPPEDQQNQVRKDGGEQPPAKNTVIPPVPMPRLSHQLSPVGTKDTTERNEGADSNQVTDKTEQNNVEMSESEKNNDPNKRSQTGKSVSNKTKLDNNQSQSPPSPEKPDQSNSGELQESPDSTHSDLDQQEQDKTGCDSPESEEQSDNNTTVSKEDQGKEEGDTDDNEGQCSAEEKQSDKESDDEDIKETMLLEQSDKKSDDEDTEETGLEQSDEESKNEDTEQSMLVKQPL